MGNDESTKSKMVKRIFEITGVDKMMYEIVSSCIYSAFGESCYNPGIEYHNVDGRFLFLSHYLYYDGDMYKLNNIEIKNIDSHFENGMESEAYFCISRDRNMTIKFIMRENYVGTSDKWFSIFADVVFDDFFDPDNYTVKAYTQPILDVEGDIGPTLTWFELNSD